MHLESKLAEVDNARKSKGQKQMAKNMILNRYLGPKQTS